MTLEQYKETYKKKIRSLTEGCTTAYNHIQSRGSNIVDDNGKRMSLAELIEDEILVHYKLDLKILEKRKSQVA